MSTINFHTKEIAVKIVYYGPGLCGKTTSLQTIYQSLPEQQRPQLVSLATEVDRTIFFDFLPIAAYRIRDFHVRLQLYTVPGQVFYNATRKLVLNGVDGVVMVLDSQKAMTDSNLESYHNLEENLAELGFEMTQIPVVLQFNKRDLSDIYSVEEMDSLYNPHRLPVFGTVATEGAGLFEVLKALTQLIVNDLLKKGLGEQLVQGSRSTSMLSFSPRMTPRTEVVSQTPEQSSLTNLLFPSVTALFGERILQSLLRKHWLQVVLEVEALLYDEARRWNATQTTAAIEPLAPFLLTRAIPSIRYVAFADAVRAARSGADVSHEDAINATLLALHAVW